MCQSNQFFNGLEMPLIGWKGRIENSPEETETAVENALQVGYRLIETSYEDRTEAPIGRVLNKFFTDEKLKREDIFVSAMLPAIGNTTECVGYFIKKSIENLQLDYIDLYIIQSPVGFIFLDDDTCYPLTPEGQIDLDRHTDLVNVYKAVELAVDEGLVKSIGLSNFNCRQLKRVINCASIQPANLQIECHAYFQQRDLRNVCEKYDVTVSTSTPFGVSDKDRKNWAIYRDFDLSNECPVNSIPLDDPVVRRLAEKNKMTRHQLLLHFLAKNKITTIVSPTNSRSQEYLKIFDSELNEKDFTTILGLDKGQKGRTFDLGKIIKEFDSHPEYPFFDQF